VEAVTPAELKRLSAVRADLASGRARQVREDAEVSLAEMAATISDTIKTTPQAVSAWELARRRPGAVRALAYGKALAALPRNS
jgi:DNA-binding transcriptional regulator YiaG